MGNIVLRKNRVTANTLIGKVGDLTYNSVDKTLFIHDGTSTGGFSLFRYSTTSAIVSGQIPFSNGTQGVLSTSTLLKWDNVNNYLGVGTSTPGYALDVNGIIKNNNDIIIAKGSSPYFGTSDNQSLIIGVNSTERFLIDTNGNIAIGNITAGNTLRYLDIKNIDSNAGSGAILRLVTSNVAGSSTSVVNLVKYKNGLFNITNTETDATACIAFTLGSSERLRIDSSGNVGINTVSPNEKLHVNGNIRLSGATSGYITLTPTAIAGTTTITLPATTGTVVTTGDTGTVTNTMLANSTISGISLGSNLATLTIGTGLSGTSYNGSTAVTITNTGVTSIVAGTGISINNSTGTVTITNTSTGGSGTGVTTLESLAGDITFVDGDITFGTSGATQITATISSTPASTLTGTIPSGVLGNSNVFIGTTSVALNRATANLALTGISSVQFPGSTSGTVTLQAAAIAGTTTITLPATTGTVVTTGDTGTVTSTMILDGTIVNGDISATAAIVYSKLSLGNSIVNADIATSAGIVYSKLSLGNSIVNADIATGAAIAVSKLAASTISGITLGNNLATLTFGSYLTGTSYNGSTATTIAVDATNLNTASKIVARDASGNFSAGTITATLFSGSGASLTSIPNGALVNSSITVNGTAISLGSSVTITANTTNSLTFNNAGSGAASGTTFNGSAAQTISYNTIGAPSITGTNASGTWGISISGNASTATTLQTGRTFSLSGDATGTSASFNGSVNASIPVTLATVNSNVGQFPSVGVTNQIPVITVNAKGLVTSLSTVNLTTSQNLALTGAVTAASTSLSGGSLSTVFGVGSVNAGTNISVTGGGTSSITISVTGTVASATTASSVTNGVYTTGSYADPSWITSLAGSKITGNISGNAANITAYTINQSVGTGNSPSFAGLTVDTNTLYVDATNNRVGINTSSPSYALHVSGAIYATGDVYAGSDIRMKENITELTNALDKIKNLQGYSYNKIGVNHRSIGLMAQDVEKIIPEVVSRNTEGMKGIDYGQMIAMLVEAIKELNTKLETINGTSI